MEKEYSFSNLRLMNQNPLEGDQDLRTSISIRQRHIQGEIHIDFLGESKDSLPPLKTHVPAPPHDSFPDAGEAINDFVHVRKLHLPPSR